MEELSGDIREAHGGQGMPRPLLRRKTEACGTDETLRAVNEFLAIVSHELRTPITAILGWTQLLGRGKDDPDRVALALEVIERNARLQARLVEELVDYTRVLSVNKLPLKAQSFPLAAAVKEAVEAVAPAAYAKRVHVLKRLGQAPCEICGDPVRLQQALTNLLSNAIKFTPAGGVVTVSLEACGRHHAITISDTGEGIEPGFLPFVFDHYRQAESAGGGGGGLGLGLAIARHIVELHGGNISAHSRGRGEGAEFTIQLPCEPARRPPVATRKQM